MDIESAREQIKNAIVAYLKKDEYGEYRVPIEKQRPVLLLGAPGIGKTAIMGQIAQEAGIGLVSCSMTHHTFQSALGLPFVVRKAYGGREYDITEHTMSEIIASIYDTIEETGVREGILFLDEINCVSETLAPAMLQFLQFKIFGRHRIPNGWIVVTAGSLPEYSKSVREFDIVTMDRLKRIDVEPDYPAWKIYAGRHGIHGSILTYLELRKSDFYAVESTVEGKSFVTARGWEDLSKMVCLYEDLGIPVDQALVAQYLQNRRIARDFALFYDLYNQYRADYQVDRILAGDPGEELRNRAAEARPDERLTLLGLLLDTVTVDMRACLEAEALVDLLFEALKEFREELVRFAGGGGTSALDRLARQRLHALEIGEKAGTLSPEQKRLSLQLVKTLERYQAELASSPMPADQQFYLVKDRFDQTVEHLKQIIADTQTKLRHLFEFVGQVYGNGQEMLVLMTELTTHYHGARFIRRFGSEDYFAHSQDLMLFGRHQAIREALDSNGCDRILA